MSPKPILKRSDSEPAHKTDRHGVRFPSSPATSTFSAYSAAVYDRSPIVVTPNKCALPERGCPGRTYTLEESQPRRAISYARDFHPRALAFASTRSSSPRPVDATIDEMPSVYPPLPQLIPDLSSESDESDGFFGPPALPQTSHPTFGIHGLAGPAVKYSSDACSDAEIDDSSALAFLPHPPSPPSQKYQYPESVDSFPQNYRRRRGERESKHECSRDPNRIPSLAFSSLSLSSLPTSPATSKKRSAKKRLPQSPQTYTPMSLSFSNLDDSCLGGFWTRGIVKFLQRIVLLSA